MFTGLIEAVGVQGQCKRHWLAVGTSSDRDLEQVAGVAHYLAGGDGAPGTAAIADSGVTIAVGQTGRHIGRIQPGSPGGEHADDFMRPPVQ